MRHLAIFCILIFLLVIIAGFCQTAVDPEDFEGKWYTADDQRVYVFQEGIIYCRQNKIPISEDSFISGAYSFSKQSVLLFVKGVEGLETETELYLVSNADGNFLCEHEDGSGRVYFIRYQP